MTTRVPQEVADAYGCAELHAVFFQHKGDDGGLCATVAVEIPEAANRMESAMATARTLRARVVLVCDTAQQAADARRLAIAVLPDHREIPYERAAAGCWGRGH